MSFQNYRLYSPREMEEIQQRYPSTICPLPSKIQIGEYAKMWVWEEDRPNPKPRSLMCVVVGVSFSTLMPGPGVRYSLAFKQADDWWIVLENVRGNVTPFDVDEFDIETDTLVEITQEMEIGLRRGAMAALDGGRTEEQEKTPEKGAHLSLVSKPNAE